MRYTGARIFPIALAGLLAALTFWLDQTTQGEEGSRSGQNRHDPDYIVDNFKVLRFDPDGALLQSLVARKMLHYPDDDTTSVVAPQLTYHTKPPTKLAAETAWLDKDGKHVRLDGNVRVSRAGNGDRLPTEIATSILYVNTETEFAHTDAPVTITQGRTVINGEGLEANNKTRISVLAGPVRGTIYPKSAQQARPNDEYSQQ